MRFDIVIRGGLVIDGSGAPGRFADVGLVGDRIRAVGALADASAGRTLDARGRIVCPGFVDIHNHADGGLLVHPGAESLVRQGVTTALIGNCGFSAGPVRPATRELLQRYMAAFLPVERVDWGTLGEFLARLEAQGLGLNIASLVGHGAVRIAAMGFDDRAPTPDELDDMRALTRQAMADGAWGLSSGLAYAPGLFAETDELTALAQAVAPYGGLYASHVRSEGDGWLGAISEAIEVGRQAGVPVQVSHIEPHYPNFGRSVEALALIDAARDEGLDVACDVPIYRLGMTTLTLLLPKWVQGGGIEGVIARLREPQVRARVARGETSFTNPAAALAAHGRWAELLILDSRRHPEFNGLDLAEISRRWGRSPWEAVFDLLIEEGRQVMIAGAFHDEEDLQRVIAHPACSVESDEGVYGATPGTSLPHPRACGTYPMLLRKYVRGEVRPELPLEAGRSILTWEAAIHKVTGLPAGRLGLADRGLLREGLHADLVILDPETVCDGATYAEPQRAPTGIAWVLVNGVPIVADGELTGVRSGRVLRRPPPVARP